MATNMSSAANSSAGIPMQHHVHPPDNSSPDGTNTSAGASSSNTTPGLAAPPALGGRTVSPRSTSPVSSPPRTSAAAVAGMTSVHWGTSQQQQQQQLTAFPNKATGNPVVIAASGIRVPTAAGSATTSATTSGAPQFSVGSSISNASPSQRSAARTKNIKSESSSPPTTSSNSGTGTTLNNRRQKRLERNRESARLSRRRRKQYLEVLEDRVNVLSIEMDKGRREHVAKSIETVTKKRNQIIQSGQGVPLLTDVLSRTSKELRVAATFQTQQLQSLSLPPHMKFLLWLTLQNDTYFRGGRAASERLSAARIGERMLTSGNDKVAPSQGMWPLICNEVGLSYDQEERARTFQRTLLAVGESWVHRHTAVASKLTMDSAHDSIQSLHHNVGEQEKSALEVLSESQRVKFLAWAQKNKEKLARLQLKRKQRQTPEEKEEPNAPQLSPNHHIAANLYILSDKLKNMLHSMPLPAPILVPAPHLKKLSRRPSFESLGSCGMPLEKEGRPLSRDHSSSGSLKRSNDAIGEMEDEDDHDQQPAQTNINPEEAQIAAAPVVDAALGFIKELIPPPKPILKVESVPNPDPVLSNYSTEIYSPVVVNRPEGVQYAQHPGGAVAYQHQHPQQQQPQHHRLQHHQEPTTRPIPELLRSNGRVSPVAISQMEDQHRQFPTFLPPSLNVVPEDMGNEDFLFDLTEEDWAIGGAFDMDTT